MRVRGERECQSCGAVWSYYETGSVECPSCGSLRSVGVEDERTLHTATPREFDLSPVRNQIDEVPLREVAERATEQAGEYVRGFGWVDAGTLRPLDDTYLAAQELRHVAGEVARRMDVTDEEEYYFLSLLRGADQGERPPPAEVPDSLRAARGLAYAEAVDEYRSDLRAYLDDPGGVVSEVLGPLRGHVKRVRALDGEVDPGQVETLVRALRDVTRYVAEDDEGALVEAQDRLSRLQ